MSRLEMTSTGLSSGRGGSAALRDAFVECCEAMVDAGGEAYRVQSVLRPGRAEVEIRGRFAEIGIDPPDELVAYWTLQDGIRKDCTGLPPLGVWDPISLENAISQWSRRRDHWGDGDRMEQEEAWLNPAWFELTGDDSWTAFLFDDVSAPCKVTRIDPEWGEPFGDFSAKGTLTSICVIFDAMTEAIRSGILYPSHLPGFNGWSSDPDPAKWKALAHGSWTL